MHAVISTWFDNREVQDAQDPHHAGEKPFSLSPCAQRAGVWGVEIGVLTERARDALLRRCAATRQVTLGDAHSIVGEPWLLTEVTWEELAMGASATAWRVEFLSPTTFRSTVRGRASRAERVSPFPVVSSLLRAPGTAWAAYGGHVNVQVLPAEHPHVWVADVDLNTHRVTLNGRAYAGVLGTATYRCDDPGVAKRVGALLSLARFSGVGSFTRRGFGVVDVTPV
ncbi:MAG: CRISPR system precrRNA processing endoribonuclease RAMP protein Cas6 [Propioniciclava sp.]